MSYGKGNCPGGGNTRENTSKDGKVQGECPSAVIDGKPGRVEVSSVTDTFIFIHDCDGSKRY